MLSLSRTVSCVSRSVSRLSRVSSVRLGSSSVNNVSNLVISDSAVSRLKNIAGDGWLRVSVEGGGCSGFQYKLDLEEGGDMAEDDVLVERDGARVVVDQTSLEYLEGATVDYHVELIRAGFRIIANPKAEGGCSCGASFNIKLEL